MPVKWRLQSKEADEQLCKAVLKRNIYMYMKKPKKEESRRI